MTGLVLCGGKSQRMGSDKGLLKSDNKNWAKIAVEKLKGLCPVKVSIHSQQADDYAEIVDAEDLIIDDATLSLHGPLLGLLSAHKKYPKEDIFVLACDMPWMDTSLLEELYDWHKWHKQADAFVFMNHEEPEPLCAIYTAKGLASILKMLEEGTLARHSMKYMLENLDIESREISAEEERYFHNFNAHADLNGL